MRRLLREHPTQTGHDCNLPDNAVKVCLQNARYTQHLCYIPARLSGQAAAGSC
jgi:hypothetical protein